MDKNSVLAVLGRDYTEGVAFHDIADELGVPKRHHTRLRKLLNKMIEAGEVSRLSRGVYAVASGGKKGRTKGGRNREAQRDAGGPHAVGQIRVHPAGYGFVVRDDGHDDVFVPAKYRGTSLDGDRVSLYTWEGYKGTEGRVEEVLGRGRAKLTGLLVKAGRTYFVEPDDPRIATDHGRIAVGNIGKAKPGLAVVVDITQYPTEASHTMAGNIDRVLGNPEEPATEIEKILACGDIPVDFAAAALERAAVVPTEVIEADLLDRVDLRDRPFATIDPETARDFDDALCIEDGPHGGPRVWIAVADVSHYVRPDDPIDLEAQVRGVSVYLPDRVIPMLPEQLSAGICSLNPGVDRCAMVVRIDYRDDGSVVDAGYAAAIIRSQARLDYPGVAAALAGDLRGKRARYRRWLPALERLSSLAQVLRKRRRRRGALELDLPEPKIVLDADDPLLVRDVVKAKGISGVKTAYELVEEFMIAANEAVGRFFEGRGLDTVWRVHAQPKESRVEDLTATLYAYGIAADPETALTPPGMQKLLGRVMTHDAGRSLGFLVLRSLMQAVYTTDNKGHFGLASEEYLHFTSPIRRYPDLLVHRLLKYHLHRDGQPSGQGRYVDLPTREQLDSMASAASMQERRAIEAERDAVGMYRAYFMRQHVGEEYWGTVTGVTNFGVFVEIDEPFVEGLIKTSTLGDGKFHFDAVEHRLSGDQLVLSLGDKVRVEVSGVSVGRRNVDFTLLSAPQKQRAKGKKRVPRAEPVAKQGGSRGRGRGPRAAQKARAAASKKSKAGGRPAGRGRSAGKASKSTKSTKGRKGRRR